MELYLLRHGLAVDLGAETFARDSERPLTAEGERKLNQVAVAMLALEVSFDLILSSPYVRAWQTAGIIAAKLHARKKVRFCDALIPGGSFTELIRTLKKSGAESALLVGHEPGLSELISLLVAGETGFPVTMKKGGLCKLTVETLKPAACARLEWLLTPKQMALMG